MNFIESIKERAKSKLMTIILPEAMDMRVLKAAEIVLKEEFAKIIILGDKDEVLNKGLNLNKAKFINPKTSELSQDFVNKLFELRKNKGMTYEEAKDLIFNDYMYFACMLVKEGMADGIVSGACHSTSNTLRPALQIIRTDENALLVSSFFLMIVPNCEYGSNGIFIFADSGLEQNPDSEKLAAIAASSAESFKLLVEEEPIVAMLSHSTMGSASHPDVDKVVEAVKIAKEKFPNIKLDGEFQLDTAIVPEIAKNKVPNNEIAGHANVLIFPDLDAGNIGYKLVQRLAKAEAYGPITQGIAAPVNDLSRGCSAEDIVGSIIITALQAQKRK